MLKFLGIVVLVLLGVGVVGALTYQPGAPTVARQEARAAAATIDKSPEMQADRKKLIEGLVAEGVFQKVEVPGSLPRLWVRPAFYSLEFERKEKFVSVVYALYFDGSKQTDSVRIFDSLSGKEVGSYSLVSGGLKMF
jgi:hypothetical protein